MASVNLGSSRFDPVERWAVRRGRRESHRGGGQERREEIKRGRRGGERETWEEMRGRRWREPNSGPRRVRREERKEEDDRGRF